MTASVQDFASKVTPAAVVVMASPSKPPKAKTAVKKAAPPVKVAPKAPPPSKAPPAKAPPTKTPPIQKPPVETKPPVMTPPMETTPVNNNGAVKGTEGKEHIEPKTQVNEKKAEETPATSVSKASAEPGTQVIVDIKNSDSGYNNKIFWTSDNFATRNYIGVDNNTGSYNIGTFKAGTQIDFGIDNGQGQFFRTGSASQNADNFEHAQVTSNSEGMQIGFEDLGGGGDKDFNDAIIQVRTVSQSDTLDKTSTNRSGLGDGTNPGQGSGRENSPNQGTENPNNAATGSRALGIIGGSLNILA